MNTDKMVPARDLTEGDVLAGSGFVVTHNAWRGVHTPRGKVNVEGCYPNSPKRTYHWNANTMLKLR